MARTEEQEEALQQLWAITASSTPAQKERDERLLRESGYDVQRTVEQIFSMSGTGAVEDATGGHGSSSSAGPSRQSSYTNLKRSPDRIERFEVDDRLTDIGPPPGARRLSGSRPRRSAVTNTGLSLWSVITFPIQAILGAVSGAWYFFIRTFLPLSLLPRLPAFLLPPSSSRPPLRVKQDPTTASLHYVRDLETFTGCSHTAGTLPDFWVGPYREFLTDVRRQGKVGVVILTCGEHEDDEEFKKDVLCDSELVRALREKEVMVWGADVRSREGYQVSQTLLTTTFPSLTFVSLLPPAAGSSAPHLSILTTLQGPPSTTTSSSAVLQTLTNSVLPRTSAYLGRLRRERAAIEESRHLREEQDRAFREAERKDREKMQAQRQAEAAERVRKEREAREAQRIVEDKAKRIQWRRYARKHLLPPSQGPIRVALRTPLGAERHMRQFEPSAGTEVLFVWAETLLIPSNEDEEDDPDSPPVDFEPPSDFRIVTQYPRREIERTPVGGEAGWETIKAAGGALFAEKSEGSEWGVEELRALHGEDSDEEAED